MVLYQLPLPSCNLFLEINECIQVKNVNVTENQYLSVMLHCQLYRVVCILSA